MKTISCKIWGILLLFVLFAVGCNPPAPEVEEQTPAVELVADKFVIRADGLDTVQLSVKVNGEEKKEECTFHIVTPEQTLKNGRFSTSKVGEYEVYALYKGQYKSNTLRIEAVALSLILNGSSDKVVADGEQQITFDVAWEGKDITSECEIRLLQQETYAVVEGGAFKTETPGKYQFQAVFRGYASNVFEVEALPLTLVMKASKEKIKADGKEEVTFSVMADDKDVSAQCQIYLIKATSATLLENGVFKTTTAGKYKFQAVYKNYRSNLLTVEAEVFVEQPIKLQASKQEIVADGKSEIVFQVLQGGVDVTAKSEIYWSSGVGTQPVLLSGTSFKTKRPGDYTFYAVMGSLKSEEIIVKATAESLPTQAGTLFARGVTKDKGWYDVNKKKDGRTRDGLLCWAASCANVLQWWQDVYTAAGYTIPANTPSGVGKEYELKIFEEFLDNWDNCGASSFIGCRWYFTGQNDAASYSIFSQPKPGSGAYLKDVYEKIKNEWGSDYSMTTGGYRTWGDGSGQKEDCLRLFSRLIIQALKDGIVVLDINPGFSGSHAITLWGCEYDAQGLIRYMYVTDSDDLIDTPSAPRVPVLHRFEVIKSPKGTREVGFKGMEYKPLFVEIQNFDTLRAFPLEN